MGLELACGTRACLGADLGSSEPPTCPSAPWGVNEKAACVVFASVLLCLSEGVCGTVCVSVYVWCVFICLCVYVDDSNVCLHVCVSVVFASVWCGLRASML